MARPSRQRDLQEALSCGLRPTPVRPASCSPCPLLTPSRVYLPRRRRRIRWVRRRSSRAEPRLVSRRSMLLLRPCAAAHSSARTHRRSRSPPSPRTPTVRWPGRPSRGRTRCSGFAPTIFDSTTLRRCPSWLTAPRASSEPGWLLLRRPATWLPGGKSLPCLPINPLPPRTAPPRPATAVVTATAFWCSDGCPISRRTLSSALPISDRARLPRPARCWPFSESGSDRTRPWWARRTAAADCRRNCPASDSWWMMRRRL